MLSCIRMCFFSMFFLVKDFLYCSYAWFFIFEIYTRYSFNLRVLRLRGSCKGC